jgi:hypothetical protein
MRLRPQIAIWAAAGALVIGPILPRGDQVQMQNGDRYFGRVLSLNTNTLVLQSEVLGSVRLPRGKVALITLGTATPTNAAGALGEPSNPPAAPTNTVLDLTASLRDLGANTNFIRQVQAQFLGDAGPEANNKFNEMVGGLMSGKLKLNDIRTEAKSAADQLMDLKRDLGDDAGWALDGYLAILENFLRETAPPPSVSATNNSGALPTAPAREKK